MSDFEQPDKEHNPWLDEEDSEPGRTTDRRRRADDGGESGVVQDVHGAGSEEATDEELHLPTTSDEIEVAGEIPEHDAQPSAGDAVEEGADTEVDKPTPERALSRDSDTLKLRTSTDKLEWLPPDRSEVEPGAEKGTEGERRKAERAESLQGPAKAAVEDRDSEPVRVHPVGPETGASNVAATKLGIVGGKGVGKSYLFQAMVYRTLSGNKSGALTYFLEKDGIQLYSGHQLGDEMWRVNEVDFIRNYSAWNRLGPTIAGNQRWYRLRLNYRNGVLGRQRSAVDVEFLDASGEFFFEMALDPENRHLWRTGFLNTGVMVFCLPLWAAFPGGDLTVADRGERETILSSFFTVLNNFQELRRLHLSSSPVRSILALTMADDPRGGLKTLRERWILSLMDRPHRFLRELRTGSGAALYLENARRVSEAVHEEFLVSRDGRVSGIPQRLDLDAGEPWLIPVSAIEGSTLDLLESERAQGVEREVTADPVPAHVELPLLVALCEHTNALM